MNDETYMCPLCGAVSVGNICECSCKARLALLEGRYPVMRRHVAAQVADTYGHTSICVPGLGWERLHEWGRSPVELHQAYCDFFVFNPKGESLIGLTDNDLVLVYPLRGGPMLDVLNHDSGQTDLHYLSLTEAARIIHAAREYLHLSGIQGDGEESRVLIASKVLSVEDVDRLLSYREHIVAESRGKPAEDDLWDIEL